jgi:hypothetical protein
MFSGSLLPLPGTRDSAPVLDALFSRRTFLRWGLSGTLAAEFQKCDVILATLLNVPVISSTVVGYGVDSAAVKRLLKEQSWVPTLVGPDWCHVSAFVTHLIPEYIGKKLGPFGLDPFAMLVVDLLHEFELGVWKTIFTHLIRLLHAAAPGGKLVAELDRR